MMIITHCSRETSFLTAEIVIPKQSMRRRIIGFFGRLFRSIPVKRPQDYAKKGRGTLTWDASEKCVVGHQTDFSTSLKQGDTLKTEVGKFLVLQIEDDTVLRVKGDASSLCEHEYTIIPKLDHSEAFANVEKELSRGRCIGIFPEGGSHDRTTLLPLKAGVCLMALGTMAKYNTPVTIQCIGLNYIRGHKFRSKAIINFGSPYNVPQELAQLYLVDKEKAVSILLTNIQKRMHNVWVTAPSYEELTSIFLARSIFLPDDYEGDTALDTEMSLKFAQAYAKVLQTEEESANEIQQVMKDVQIYYQKLKRFGIHDYQVKKSSQDSLFYLNMWVLVSGICALIFGLPAWIFTMILGCFVKYLSERERVKAVEGSSVKIHGYDVLASTKVIYGLFGFFLLSLALGFLSFFYIWAYVGFAVALKDVLIFAFIWPVYFCLSIDMTDRSLEALVRMYANLFSALSPRLLEKLRKDRNILREKISNIVDKYGPQIFPELKPEKLFRKKSERASKYLKNTFNGVSNAWL